MSNNTIIHLKDFMNIYLSNIIIYIRKIYLDINKHAFKENYRNIFVNI